MEQRMDSLTRSKEGHVRDPVRKKLLLRLKPEQSEGKGSSSMQTGALGCVCMLAAPLETLEQTCNDVLAI